MTNLNCLARSGWLNRKTWLAPRMIRAPLVRPVGSVTTWPLTYTVPFLGVIVISPGHRRQEAKQQRILNCKRGVQRGDSPSFPSGRIPLRCQDNTVASTHCLMSAMQTKACYIIIKPNTAICTHTHTHARTHTYTKRPYPCAIRENKAIAAIVMIIPPLFSRMQCSSWMLRPDS